MHEFIRWLIYTLSDLNHLYKIYKSRFKTTSSVFIRLVAEYVVKCDI